MRYFTCLFVALCIPACTLNAVAPNGQSWSSISREVIR
jgi:hypothetical protein